MLHPAVNYVVGGFFDFGIGNGLRNNFAESLAKHQVTNAVGHISLATLGLDWIGFTVDFYSSRVCCIFNPMAKCVQYPIRQFCHVT